MAQNFICLAKQYSPGWVLEADIKGCFDHIDHEWLVTNVPMDKGILRKWLKAGTLYRGEYSPTEAGTPQGGIISPTLANMALNGLEGGLRQHVYATLGHTKAQQAKVNVIRYADDFVITGSSQEVLVEIVRPWVERFLAIRGLELSATKTRVTHINAGFDFLGWNFRKYNGKLLIKPSKQNVSTFYRKVKGVISGHKTIRQELLIKMLNPMLRGWANYHHPVVAKRALSRMDALVFKALWRWCRRRHNNKGSRWVKERYFHAIENRRWVFAASHDGKSKEPLRVLYRLADTPIVRHVKVKAEYNPFDLAFEQYGEKRRQDRMLRSRAYRTQWANLFLSQQGLCAHCGHPITEETGWHDHHIVPKMAGGSDLLSNRVLLHPGCHTQVHALDITVVKP